MRTNYGLGIDNPQKVTDSAARFADTKSAFRSGSVVSPFDDNKKNKAKNNDLDSIVIAGNNFFDSTVSSKTQFRDTLNASRKMNTGLDPLTQSYIQGSHFKPGYGGFGGQPENQRAFQPSTRVANNLSPERIKFFKDAHFDHADRSQNLMGLTSMNSSFYEKDGSGKRSINDGNNAYNLRNKVHDNG